MENNTSNVSTPFSKQETQEALPKAIGVLITGILSINLSFVYGIPGVVLAIVALVMAKQSTAIYEAEPDRYKPAFYKMLKAGRLCGIIGLILSIIMIIVFAGVIIYAVSEASSYDRYYY